MILREKSRVVDTLFLYMDTRYSGSDISTLRNMFLEPGPQNALGLSLSPFSEQHEQGPGPSSNTCFKKLTELSSY